MPKLALIFFVNIANPFVGSGPSVNTCIPAEASPDTSAGSKVYPERRVSFAITAVCLTFFKFLKYLSTYQLHSLIFSLDPSFQAKIDYY